MRNKNAAIESNYWADFRDSPDRSRELMRDYTSRRTGSIVDPKNLGSELAYVALWAVKLDLAEHRAEAGHYDEAAVLRALGEQILNLACDWAEQFEGGATDYS